jgi:hypothetical protein
MEGKNIGSGSDGFVKLYTHKYRPTIAVKWPRPRREGETAETVKNRQ